MAASAAVPAAGSWGKAIEVPGLAALKRGGNAFVDSVSCASAGNCAAGGAYFHRGRRSPARGFVAVERNGRWGRAIQIPGLKALNKRTDGRDLGTLGPFFAVSCAPVGTCVAGGYYIDASDRSQAFVTQAR